MDPFDTGFASDVSDEDLVDSDASISDSVLDEDTHLTLFDQVPFDGLEISSLAPLLSCPRRKCIACRSRVRYYCNNCLRPCSRVPSIPPLPFKIDVWKHRSELKGKSTALHAKILDRWNDVCVMHYPLQTDCYNEDPNDIIVLYPSPRAQPIGSIPSESYKRLVVIDGTWHQAKQMIRDSPFLLKNRKSIRYVTLQEPPRTSFWRFQQMSPTYLATIEAIWCALRDFELAYPAQIDQLVKSLSYHSDNIEEQYDTYGNPIQLMPLQKHTRGHHYDDILWLYVFQYQLILATYRDKPTRPFIARHTGDFRDNLELARNSK